jgi:preprotein translocase subunit SecA
MTRFNLPEDVPLEHPLVSKSIENAQVKVEGFNFDNRKHVVEYDDVLNKQREIIYSLRKKILKTASSSDDSLKEEVKKRVHKVIENIVNSVIAQMSDGGGTLNEDITSEMITIIPFDTAAKEQIIKQLSQLHEADQKIDFLVKLADDVYNKREEQVGTQVTRQVEKFVMLQVIDNLWMNHLDAIDNLRQGIGLRGYAQRDPLVEYKNEAFTMFEQLMFAIDDDIVHRIYKIQVQQETPIQQPHVHHNLIANVPTSEVSEENRNKTAKADPTTKKLSRNDPCPCGSGKKWKKCHYPQIP